jgi:Gpi18-like mannosyltransferase
MLQLAQRFFVTILNRIRKTSLSYATIFVTGMIFSIALRLSLVDNKTLDYYADLKPWYNIIISQGFSAFATNFSNYNPPYLYLLYIITRLFPGTPIVIAVKLPSLIADFICGYLVYCIVQISYKNNLIPLLAGITVLFAPTVVLNSAFWGQADSLFTAGILACVYYLMINKYSPAFFSFGVALAFKLQAIFLLPLLLVLLVKKYISWKYFLIIPFILILALIPAWTAGRPLFELINIYTYQTTQFQLLTMNAASIYSWLPTTNLVFNLFYIPGVLAGAIAAFMFIMITYKSTRDISRQMILELALLVTLIIPFFLPKMHERYFYPADVISIAYAFYYPKFFYLPFLVGGASFLSYQSFLFGGELVPLPIATFVLIIAISILLYHILLQLYSQTTFIINHHPLDSPNNNTKMTPQGLMDQNK